MNSFKFWLNYSEKNIWLLNIQCSWMIHCTNLKRFPRYLKCPIVNHSITSDENSLRPPCKRPGIPSRGPASLWVISSVSKWVGAALWAKGLQRQRLIGSALVGFSNARTITRASAAGFDTRQDDYNKGICSPGSLVNNPVR